MTGTLPERIFLCGFMGAGKSTIGNALAKKLEQPFYDLDAFIKKKAGQSIAAIFESEGENAFRKKEEIALLEIIREKKGIIALGGGTLQNQHIIDHIKVNGLLVFLDTPMDEIINRIMKNRNRPLLLDKDGNLKSKSLLRQHLLPLLEQRLPFYQQAEITIKAANHSSFNSLTNELIKKIRYHVALH